MTTELILLIAVAVLTVVNLLIILFRKSSGGGDDLSPKLMKIDTDLSRIDPLIREEFMRSRDESRAIFRENREELGNSFKILGENLTRTITELSNAQKNQFDTFSSRLNEMVRTLDEKNTLLREQLDNSAKDNRTEQANSLKSFEEKFSMNVNEFNELQKQKFEDFVMRQENIRKETELRLREIRETVEGKLNALQEDNTKKLEEMRKTVDEKLQETVEKRFSESFKMISERLEQVHKGLGEMQTLASGVGDLKKVLANVKTRGNLGEYQLGAILEQILSPEQYVKNAAVKEGSQERVEYAIRLPGKDSNDKPVMLPVDSKFPVEDYQRLLDAYDSGNATEVDAAAKQFENSVRKNARDIRDKYVSPPSTTDFAIMFVPTEGLYAEITRRTGLFEQLQREFKIVVAGPSNFAALLNSFQMGFRTLAIEKRSSEVWEILGAVKSEFGNFGNILEKTKKKLEEATNVIDKAGARSRSIERKLRDVQELPQEESVKFLGKAGDISDGEDHEEE